MWVPSILGKCGHVTSSDGAALAKGRLHDETNALLSIHARAPMRIMSWALLRRRLLWLRYLAV